MEKADLFYFIFNWKRAEFLVISEACKTIFCPTPGLQAETLTNRGWFTLKGDLNLCVRGIPRRAKPHKSIISQSTKGYAESTFLRLPQKERLKLQYARLSRRLSWRCRLTNGGEGRGVGGRGAAGSGASLYLIWILCCNPGSRHCFL